MNILRKGISKRENIKKFICGFIAILLIFLGGYCFGKGMVFSQEQDDAENITINTDRIAIVNADQGVQMNGEQINYAALLMTAFDENYSMENLETAKKGIENGTYAAYILIPSTFSESVISLNSIPKQAKIEYVINPYLTEERKIEAIYNVVNFEHVMNCKMSYMYIASILEEFHSAQDAAQTIMTNDVRDTEVLLAIQPYDLIEMVSIGELQYVDNSVEPLDITRYNQSNEEIIGEVHDKYAYYITLSEADMEVLNVQGSMLIEQWTIIEKNIADINLTMDADGTLIYASGINNIAGILDTYNMSLDEAEYNIANDLCEVKEIIDYANSSYSDLIDSYNKNLQSDSESIARQIQSDLRDNLLPSVTNSEEAIRIDDEEILISYQGGSIEEINQKYELLKSYLIQIDDMMNDSSYSDLEELQNAYNEYLADWQETEAVLEECREKNIFTVDINALSEDMEEAFRNEMEEHVPTVESIQKIIEDNRQEFRDEIIDKDGAMQEEYENMNSVSGLLSEASEMVQEKLNDEGGLAIPKLDGDAMQEIIHAEIVEPLDAHVGTIQDDLLEQFRNEREAFEEYNAAYMAYDPVNNINNSEIQAMLSGINANNTAIQSTVTSNYMQNMEYVSEVYQNAELNVTALQQSLLDANSASNEAVTGALADAKSLKSETSAANQTLLQAFVTKLPYTRLGNIENTVTYEFIANPSTLIDVTEEEGIVTSTPLSFDNNIQIRTGLEDSQKILIIVALICTALAAVVVVWWIIKKRKESQQLEKIY